MISKLITSIGVTAAAVIVAAGPAQAAAPVAADDAISAVAGTTFTLPAPGVLANDSAVPPGAGVHWQTPPPSGLTLNDDGSISYVVPANAGGSGTQTYTFAYCVLDLPGSPSAQCISNQATVTVTVTAPHAVDDAYDAVAGQTVTIPAPGVLGNDQHLAPGAVAQYQTNPPSGLTLSADGSITYVVPPTAAGTQTFTYCVLDLPGTPLAQCVSNLATVTVNVATPHAADDTYDVVAGTTLTVPAPGVLVNDTNLPDVFFVGWQTAPPAGLTLSQDGAIVYSVPAEATGESSFTYCLLDKTGTPFAQCISNLATVTVRVVPPNTATPTASSGSTATAGPTLPRTGPATGLLVGVGLVLVVTGTVAILVVYRRRTAAPG